MLCLLHSVQTPTANFPVLELYVWRFFRDCYLEMKSVDWGVASSCSWETVQYLGVKLALTGVDLHAVTAELYAMRIEHKIE